MAYMNVGGRSYIAQKSPNSIAVVWVMQMGEGHTGMIDSCTQTNKGRNILYRPSHAPPKNECEFNAYAGVNPISGT